MLRCHSRELFDRVRTARGWFDPDTLCTETTHEAALLAAGAAIEAARRGAFALARPPGHHAERNRPMGFCFYDNVAIAARWAQAELAIERVAILDWDVHHGNGTQDIVEDDDSILFVSLHQWPFYPGTGGPYEQGETLVNIPMNAGDGDDEYFEAWQTVERAVKRFDPGLLLVSAGFDAHVDDPLADIQLSTDAFRELARRGAGARPARGRRARGRVQPADAPVARRGRARGLRRLAVDVRGEERDMSDLEREQEELADDEAGSTASGQPWAKTSSGDADSMTTDDDAEDRD